MVSHCLVTCPRAWDARAGEDSLQPTTKPARLWFDESLRLARYAATVPILIQEAWVPSDRSLMEAAPRRTSDFPVTCWASWATTMVDLAFWTLRGGSRRREDTLGWSGLWYRETQHWDRSSSIESRRIFRSCSKWVLMGMMGYGHTVATVQSASLRIKEADCCC